MSALVDNIVKLAAVAPNLVEVSVVRDKLGVPEPAKDAEVIGLKASPSPEPLPVATPGTPPEERPLVSRNAAQSVHAGPPAPESFWV